MRYAIFSDIHANRQAWESVLLDIRGVGVDELVCLGDVVGYGPMPQAVLDAIRELTPNFVLGNHDAAVCGRMDAAIFNEQARAVIEWTRERIDDEGLRFLSEVPFAIEAEDVLFVHAEVEEPGRFGYVVDTEKASECFAACQSKLIFLGHTHEPAVYVEEGGELHSHDPADFHLKDGERYLVNVGSVGEPRDADDLRACYVIYDSDTGLVQFRRVEFDFDGYRVDVRREGLEIEPYFLRIHDYEGGAEERTLLVPQAPAMKRAPVLPVVPVKAGPPARLVKGMGGQMPAKVSRVSSGKGLPSTGGREAEGASPKEMPEVGRGAGRSIPWNLVSTVIGMVLLAVGAPVAWVLVKKAEPGLRSVAAEGGAEADGKVDGKAQAAATMPAKKRIVDGGVDADLEEGSSLSDGLLSYWNFDKRLRAGEGSMPIIGVASRGPQWSEDQFGGYALRLDGRSQVVLGSKSLYAVREGEVITTSLWVLKKSGGSKKQPVLSNGGEDISNAGWGVYSQSNAFTIQASSGEGPGSLRRAEVKGAAGWCHLVMVIDMKEGELTCYRNGVPMETRDIGGLGAALPAKRSLIAGQNVSGRGLASFQGVIDDLAIWRRALTRKEIKAIYDHGKRGKAPLGKLLSPEAGESRDRR